MEKCDKTPSCRILNVIVTVQTKYQKNSTQFQPRRHFLFVTLNSTSFIKPQPVSAAQTSNSLVCWNNKPEVAGGDIRQKLEIHHVHLKLGALGYIETFLFYWSWGFFQKKTPPWPIFVFENTRVPPLDLKKYFF